MNWLDEILGKKPTDPNILDDDLDLFKNDQHDPNREEKLRLMRAAKEAFIAGDADAFQKLEQAIEQISSPSGGSHGR